MASHLCAVKALLAMQQKEAAMRPTEPPATRLTFSRDRAVDLWAWAGTSHDFV